MRKGSNLYMFTYVGMSYDLYKIKDSSDNSIELLSYSELVYCVKNLGINIYGVIWSKRTEELIVECIRGGYGHSKSPKYFREEVFNLVGDEYTVVDDYIKNCVRICFRHNVCGNNYIQEPRLFLDGKRCPHCFRLVKSTTKEFKDFIESVVGDEYELLSEYVGANDSVSIRHNKCGLVYDVVASGFKRGHRCPRCTKSGVPVRSYDEVAKLVEDVSSHYKLIDYRGSVIPSRFLHLLCGNEFEMRTTFFIRFGNRCPICNISVPERLLQLELKKWFLDCQCNIRPDWLRAESGYQMELDVYIASINTVIEFDGNYHETRSNSDSFKDIKLDSHGLRVIRIRDSKLPELNTNSIQIKAVNPINLRRYSGIKEFERLMNELLRILGISNTYVVDLNILEKLYDNKTIVKSYLAGV